MSDSSDRLAQTRLAIIEHIQKKNENKSSLRAKLRSVAAMAGFGSGARTEHASASRDSGMPDFTAPSPAQRAPRAATMAAEDAMEAAGREQIAAVDRLEQAEAARPDLPGHDPASRKARRAERLFKGRWAGLGEAGRSYLEHHPLNLVLELATPAMARYAQRRPAAFLAYSAAAGALIYLARPWRLISVTGLAVAALRSPQISSALISALYGEAPDADVE